MIAIVGPTASGKSKLALSLAQDFPAEIISADSRQVYRYMDIGTNKPTIEERASIHHHIVDVVNPDENFSLVMYHRLVAEAAKDIQCGGKLPLLVGGSGLYVWSLVEGWKLPQVSPAQELRHELEIRAKQEGSHVLYQELQGVDPLAASKIHPNNIRRIIRALEVYYKTGQLPSNLWRKEAPNFPVLIIGLTTERSELYNRIDLRVDRMIERGFIDEVKMLLEMGYGLSLPSMSSTGYRQIGEFLQGKLSLPAAIEQVKYGTHHLARHQYAWFRLSDARIHWLDAGRPFSVLSEASNLIGSFVRSGLQQEGAS